LALQSANKLNLKGLLAPYSSRASSESFFKKRSGTNTKEKYRLTQAEMKQAEQIALIFSKFDFDKSGSLDTSELTALFKENQYDVDTEKVRKMFGGGAINLTPQSLEEINHNKADLQSFRKELQTLRKETIEKRVALNIAAVFK